MNLDDILELAAARRPSSLDRARTRRAAQQVLQLFSDRTAEGRDLLGDLDAGDIVAAGTDEAARIIRSAESVQAGWLRWTAGTGTLVWSAELSRLCGDLAVKPYVTRERLTRAVHPDDRDTVAAAVHEAWQRRGPAEFSFRLMRSDGALRYVRCLLELLTPDGITPTGAIATVEDVTRIELDKQAHARHRRRERTTSPVPARPTVLLPRRDLPADLGRLRLWAQPVLDLTLNEITRAEILLRVTGSDGRPHPPSAYLDAAGRNSSILSVDRWVVDRSLALIGQGPQTVQHQINLSGRAVSDPAFTEYVLRALNRHHVDGRVITFEITESLPVDDLAAAAGFAAAVRACGCELALDDFGTGWSTLSLLKHLPIDLLKLDGTFVTGLRSSAFDRPAVESLVTLCREIGVRVAAEFVEDTATLDLLRDLGVDFAQGYVIGRPRPMATPAIAGPAPAAGWCQAGPTAVG
jgi:EAL domain-containing protein (putative c-di-GMP-specific phosphodiesterase class I)